MAASLALLGVVGSASAETVSLKVWSLKTVGQTGWEDFFNNAIAEYKTTHPDVDIVLEQFPNEAYKTTIQVALVGSDPPDIFFNWSGEDAARLARDGLALDITDLGKGPTGFESELSPGWLSAFQYNGKYYGAPTDAVSKYFYYNKKFFAEHNLTAARRLRRVARSLPGDPQDRPEHRADAARQLRALEAQPLHHHAEPAGAGR